MKRKKITRLASILFALVLVTTCVISGTFAKYITNASSGDQKARVAKWGVTISTDGELFGTQYTSLTDSGIIVKSSGAVSDISNVVAPGTGTTTDLDNSNVSSKFTFTIGGEPETAVKISISAEGDEIGLNNGTVIDKKYTYNGESTTISGAYNPVKFTLKKLGDNGNVDSSFEGVTDGSLEEVCKKINKVETVYGPGEDFDNIAGTYQLTWKWDFEGDNTNNEYDTILGNISAAEATVDGAKTETNFTISISAEQVNEGTANAQ
jgi:hypothetical protein